MFFPTNEIRSPRVIKEAEKTWKRASNLRLQVIGTFDAVGSKQEKGLSTFPVELDGSEITARFGPNPFAQIVEIDETITHAIVSFSHAAHEDAKYPKVRAQIGVWTAESSNQPSKVSVVEFGPWRRSSTLRCPSVSFSGQNGVSKFVLIGDTPDPEKLIGFCVPGKVRERLTEKEDLPSCLNNYLKLLMTAAIPALRLLEMSLKTIEQATNQSQKKLK